MIKKNLLVFVLLFPFLLTAQDHQTEFIKSFVTHYDFSPEGRYTHEYHPFLLKQTRAGLEKFESFLDTRGFDIQDRIIIMGYQQEGVPSYYSNNNAHIIDDEISLKTKKGRIVPAHNIFGFLTGFLLKDCNWLQKKWFLDEPLLIEHIQPERVELFDDQAYLFQKHAFGSNFGDILAGRNSIEKSLKNRTITQTLQQLTFFWEQAYNKELKSCGQEVLATQDILFSVDYAKHLTKTKIPVKKMYVGPDITYPIEVLPFQEQAVTESAQYFVKQFTSTLQARDNKKTAYVFCSFVDGVGKSTLLGNVINYAQHGDNIKNYERVDNSSSQRGTLYSLEDDVFIMDLPAQLSHWVSKPDGYVFVDVGSVKEVTQTERHTLAIHLKDACKKYINNFEKRLQCKNLTQSNYDVYVKNAQLFDPEDRWIPFEQGEHLFLFNEYDNSKIKILVPLEGVHSRGLKTVQPEQMLFTKGLLLPMQYDAFVEDIAQQFKTAGIEKLVFVDFLSMYPRSSRENVRINFLMQQLRTLFPNEFRVQESLYKSFINRGPELYHLLSQFQSNVTQALYLETIVRTALYNLFKEQSSGDVVSLSESSVTQALNKEVKNVLSNHQELLQTITTKKVEEEYNALKKYAHDKNYEVFVRFSFEPLVAFSQFMEQLFSHDIDNKHIHDLWSDIKNPLVMKTMHTCDNACRDSVVLSSMLINIRAHWYAALGNLLHAEQEEMGMLTLEKPEHHVSPLVITTDGKQVSVLQKRLMPAEDTPRILPKTLQKFQNYAFCGDLEWGLFNDIPHCLEWKNSETYWGIYAFGCSYEVNGLLRNQLQKYEKESRLEGLENVALTSLQVYEQLEQTGMWQEAARTMNSNTPKKIQYNSKQYHALQLWVRAIATLEMIAKDPQVWIMTRKGNKQDFAATVQLLERIILVKYFGITLEKPLFTDYSLVQPVIPWDVIQK
ncbi:MAG: hypothetical protein ACJAZS_000074 [Alteromonas naphthalenivorans]|jgi:hypothetical protein